MAKKSSDSLYEKIAPVLLIVVIALAFAVGVLWQKVSDLQGGGGITTTGNSAAAPAAPAQPSSQAVKLSNLSQVAENIGVDVGQFESCLESGGYEEVVEADYQAGIKAGVTGTPGNFVINKDGEVWQLPGAVPYSNLKNAIEQALGNTVAGASPSLSPEQAQLLPPVDDSDHINGNRDAEVIIVEYSDFECPFCARFHPTAIQALEEYGDRLALVYRHFPLDSIHPLARNAAIASECVAAQGGNEAFWAFADEIFVN